MTRRFTTGAFAIAATLLKDPDLLIFDEPTNGLDPAGIREIRQTMRGLADGGAIAAPMLQTLAWTFALVGVFGWFAVRGYRRAAAE